VPFLEKKKGNKWETAHREEGRDVNICIKGPFDTPLTLHIIIMFFTIFVIFIYPYDATIALGLSCGRADYDRLSGPPHKSARIG